MVSTQIKKHPKVAESSATPKNEKKKGVTCVKCNRTIENGESCNKNLLTGEITCHDCMDDLELKDNNFLAIE
jgi:hypothetical protein